MSNDKTEEQAGSVAEPVGEAVSMPGASRFTMACFKADDVPIGTKLYAAPPDSGKEDAEKKAARWEALTEPMIDEFLEDYEMVGESEDGRDACYVPSGNEKHLIKDAIMGLLQEAWGRAASAKKEQP